MTRAPLSFIDAQQTATCLIPRSITQLMTPQLAPSPPASYSLESWPPSPAQSFSRRRNPTRGCEEVSGLMKVLYRGRGHAHIRINVSGASDAWELAPTVLLVRVALISLVMQLKFNNKLLTTVNGHRHIKMVTGCLPTSSLFRLFNVKSAKCYALRPKLQ